MDKTELNNERAETRRHISIDESDPEGVIFASKDCVEQLVEDKELHLTKGRVCQIEKVINNKMKLFFITN